MRGEKVYVWTHAKTVPYFVKPARESFPVCGRTEPLILFAPDPSLGLGQHVMSQFRLRSLRRACPRATWRECQSGECALVPPPDPQMGSSPRTLRQGLSTQQVAHRCGARPRDRLGSSVRHPPRGDSWKPTSAHSEVQVSASRSGLTDFTLVLLGINAFFFFF